MGITSEAKMKQMNVENPIYGYIFDYMVIKEGDSIHFLIISTQKLNQKLDLFYEKI